MLLTLPFWRASSVPFRAIGVVRHPLAVARSLASWREMPLADGVALWIAHARALADDRARHGYAVIDFDQPAAAVAAAVRDALGGAAIDVTAYDDTLVHHDAGDAPAIAGLDDAVALYRALGGGGGDAARATFPRASMTAFARALDDGDVAAAIAHAGDALAAVADATAVIVPVATALVRRRAYAEARALIAAHADRLAHGLGDLLAGKVSLAAGDAAGAVRHLDAACAVAEPLFQARHLRPIALRAAGCHADARAAMLAVAAEALYPHNPLATLAEWRWLDGEPDAALAEMQLAIDAAPLHRRGRLRTRRAEWLASRGDLDAARAELLRALDEDPAYERSREVINRLATG
jgi:hypothetical protein